MTIFVSINGTLEVLFISKIKNFNVFYLKIGAIWELQMNACAVVDVWVVGIIVMNNLPVVGRGMGMVKKTKLEIADRT